MIEDDDTEDGAAESTPADDVAGEQRLQGLAILLSMDTVQEGMHVGIEKTLLGPNTSFTEVANDCNGKTGLVTSMNSKLGSCQVEFPEFPHLGNVWLPVGCLVLVDVDQQLWDQWLDMQKAGDPKAVDAQSSSVTGESDHLVPPLSSTAEEIVEDQKRILDKLKNGPQATVRIDDDFMTRVALATAANPPQ